MKVLRVRNVHDALLEAVHELKNVGFIRDSRYGLVYKAQGPVTTQYLKPLERVILFPERDANPFLHLYESIWMLSGRRDIAPLTMYAKSMAEFSDDGIISHDAYGYRWRTWFGFDQLTKIAETLIANKDDRRCVLQMWDAQSDLGKPGRAFPCNLMCTFQINEAGSLDMVVFCRSNDVVWGAYGANAVHFSMLLEYMARQIGVSVGQYEQISVNWHGYQRTLEPLFPLLDRHHDNPYAKGLIHPMPMPEDGHRLDGEIKELDGAVDYAQKHGRFPEMFMEPHSLWFQMVYIVLRSHFIYKTHGKFQALESLKDAPSDLAHADWIVAAQTWLHKRK